MAKIMPFHGLLPVPEKAAEVAAVPYDVVNSQEAAELAKGNSLSFLHVSRPEIDMEPGINLYDDSVYAKAAENFKKLCDEAPLKIDADEHLYIYRQIMGDHIQTGILGAASAEDYKNNIIKKHEKTRQDKEDDRTRHVMTLRSHTGPAFLTYEDSDEINSLVEKLSQDAPLFDFTAEDGIQHTLWRVDAEKSKKLSGMFAEVPYLYIADGHHRSAAAARTQAECTPQNPDHTGVEDYNFFLAVTFPASQLKVLPYNRAVKTLNGLTAEHLIEKVSENFTVTSTDNPEPQKSGEFCMYLAGKWYLVVPKFDVNALGVIERLDVSVLQDNILAPMLGIDDPRTSKGIDFVGGIRGIGELEKLVDGGTHGVAFSMFPTSVKQLMDIADADAIMPPKSTWFEPKLRDGVVCHNF
ncbi:MAG: DUF1015 domain-containing protein [Lentisphaerae bacterium]|nr:DUF1015 domain-containing protein [Lentisphaerota bacterium]MCP4102056.1 DUF1015 domain-containing protein [Lentisphaerota bacterium]